MDDTRLAAGRAEHQPLLPRLDVREEVGVSATRGIINTFGLPGARSTRPESIRPESIRRGMLPTRCLRLAVEALLHAARVACNTRSVGV